MKLLCSIVFMLVVKVLFIVSVVILKLRWNEWLFRFMLLMVVVWLFISIVFWCRKFGW